MRRINLRVVVAGAVLLVLAAIFFFGMLMFAAKSNDPATMMRIVGQVSGVMVGIGAVMIIVGLIGRK